MALAAVDCTTFDDWKNIAGVVADVELDVKVTLCGCGGGNPC